MFGESVKGVTSKELFQQFLTVTPLFFIIPVIELNLQ